MVSTRELCIKQEKKKGGDGGSKTRGTLTGERHRVSSQDPLDLITLTELESGVSPDAELTRAPFILIRRVHVVPARKSTATVRRPPPAPKAERAGVSGGDAVARQCALIGNSFNDEQWSDDLRSRQTTVFEFRSTLGRTKHEPESLRGLVRTGPQRGFRRPTVQRTITN